MSRNKGTFNFSANFEPLLKAPLDARSVVQNYTDLINPSTWMDADNLVWLYDGAIVAVVNDPSRGIYFLKESSTYINYSSWEKAGTGTATDTSIKGVLNVGDGSANVFVSIDSSGNVLLRSFVGTGAAVVYEDGNRIVVGLDASFAGEVNYGINIGSGDVSLYYGKNLEALEFRTIKAGTGITLTYQDASTIRIDASISGSIDGSILASRVIYDPSMLDPSLSMPLTVGGIPAGTKVYDLRGDSVTTILNDLLFPTQYPTLTGPSNSFTITPTSGSATLQEVGAVININSVASLNRGSISPQYSAASPYRSGLSNGYDYSGTGLVDVSSAVSPNNQTITSYTVLIGNQPNWTSRIYYDAGVQPYDNKGNIYNTPLAAGVTGTISRTFEGVYPLFATTVNITTLTQQSLNSMLSGNNISMTVFAETGGNKQKFEIPTAWTGPPTNRPLVAVQQYNTVSAQWEYPGGTAATSLLLWTTSAVTETVQGNIINYTRYTYNGTDRSSVQIRLVF
jgi:hypothetical protein